MLKLMLCKHPYLKADQENRHKGIPRPCGQCLHCRINKAREVKHRILLEMSQHTRCSFVTLTYNKEYVPKDGSLKPEHLTKFLKRLRKLIHPAKIRYFAVGEYGGKSMRPHYHLAIFGIGHESKEWIKKAWKDPETKEEIGFIHVGELNQDSASYMSGYITKGMTSINQFTDEYLQGKHPEFCRQSKGSKDMKGGLGYQAVMQIAKKINKNHHYTKESKTIRELRYGKTKLPLGRYLTNELKNAIDVKDIETLTNEEHRYELEFLKEHSIDGEEYIETVLSKTEKKRRFQDRRFRLYSKKGELHR